MLQTVIVQKQIFFAKSKKILLTSNLKRAVLVYIFWNDWITNWFTAINNERRNKEEIGF